jgi:hypothetical protein
MHRRWVANTSIVNMPASHKTPRITAEANMEAAADLTQLRHPDPALTPKLELKVPGLQVLGSWAKIPVKSPARVLMRFGFTSFIWKSMFSTISWGRCFLNFLPFRSPVCCWRSKGLPWSFLS